MYTHLLEVFEPRSRKRPIIVRLTNLHTGRAFTLLPRVDHFSDLFNVFPDRFFDGSVLIVRNTSAVRHDVPAPTHFLEAKLNLRKAIANLNYTERQQEILRCLDFVQKENGDYYTEKYRGPQGKTEHLSGEIRVVSSAAGALTYYQRRYPESPWRLLEDLDLDHIPDFILQGE